MKPDFDTLTIIDTEEVKQVRILCPNNLCSKAHLLNIGTEPKRLLGPIVEITWGAQYQFQNHYNDIMPSQEELLIKGIFICPYCGEAIKVI